MPARTPTTRAHVFIKVWLPLLAWMVFIFCVSSVPGRKIPTLFFYQDIAYHAAAYMVLALLFGRVLMSNGLSSGSARFILFVLIFGIVYGIIDEFHQRFVPGRQAALFDVSVDGLGSFIGSLFYRWQR